MQLNLVPSAFRNEIALGSTDIEGAASSQYMYMFSQAKVVINGVYV